MILRRIFAASLAAVALVGCSATPSAKTATVTPGDMPESGDWTGVYFEPLYGYFHLVKEGNAINGKWDRPQKDKWGEIHGEVTGNLFKFTWSEYTRGAVGMNSERSGKGYFVYSRPAGENVDDVLEGEFGKGQDEVGEKVSLVKQRNQKADPASIGGTQATDIAGGDWDKGSTETGTPEEPPAP